MSKMRDSMSRTRLGSRGSARRGDGADSDEDARSISARAPESRTGDRLAQMHEKGGLYPPQKGLSGPGLASYADPAEAIKKALSGTGRVAESSIRLEPVPEPGSRRFEAWARMRFGVLV